MHRARAEGCDLHACGVEQLPKAGHSMELFLCAARSPSLVAVRSHPPLRHPGRGRGGGGGGECRGCAHLPLSCCVLVLNLSTVVGTVCAFHWDVLAMNRRESARASGPLPRNHHDSKVASRRTSEKVHQ
eukprot:SAG25_NODE_543_length_7045_cov_4.651166_6_plen_129_part_00